MNKILVLVDTIIGLYLLLNGNSLFIQVIGFILIVSIAIRVKLDQIRLD